MKRPIGKKRREALAELMKWAENRMMEDQEVIEYLSMGDGETMEILRGKMKKLQDAYTDLRFILEEKGVLEV